MTLPSLQPTGLWPLQTHDAAADVVARSEVVRHTMQVAAGLAVGGRRIDLTGLDHTVGLLCAKALDLSPAEGRAARTGLVALLTEVDALSLALRAKGP